MSGQKESNSVLDVAQSSEMMTYLVFVHSLRSEHIAGKVVPDELINQNPRELIVKPLFLLVIDVEHFCMNPNQHSEGFLVDIVVEVGSQHALVVVKPFEVPARLPMKFREESFQNLFRLALLLDKGYYQPNDIRNNVSVLNLLHLRLSFP